MKSGSNGILAEEEVALKKEQAYIKKILGVEDTDDEVDSAQEVSSDEVYEAKPLKCLDRAISVMSNDGGYASASEEEKIKELNKSVSVILEINPDESHVVNETVEKYQLHNLPDDLKKYLPGLNYHLPNDYSVPIDQKPEWLDMKKFKIGQQFARQYFFGLNYSDMLSLMILFAFPDGLEPLIYTKNSGTPFTAFRRYLSTVLRVNSWYEHDVWSKGNLGFQNIKTVRALHLNVSKRLNSTPYDELENQITIYGSSNQTGIWSTRTNEVQEDFRSGCPFQAMRPVDHKRPNKIFVSQLDMSITQFGFFGLMIMYPEKFGAGNAKKEELDGFVHLWRGLGYLLGIEDKYNFCNGTYEEVLQRCHHLVDHWVKPSFQNVTEDWEHMSRCMVEGLSYYVPGVTFEVSLLYLCWVLDIKAPRLQATLSWGQTIMFYIMKTTMCFTLRLPGMLPFHNWLLRKALARASSLPPLALAKLEAKKYNYETKGKFNTRL